MPRFAWLLIMRCRRRSHRRDAHQLGGGLDDLPQEVEDVRVVPLLGSDDVGSPAVFVLREDEPATAAGHDCDLGRYKLVYLGNRAWQITVNE
jgi:hypothetical protein